MFRDPTTGRHRHAIGVALRAPEGTYDAGPPEIVVDPAADARLVVRVDNRSACAEQLELAVEGMPAGWAEVWPGSVHVPSGEQREAEVTVHVPASAEVKAAAWPLRVVAFARGRRVGSAPARVCVAPHPVVSLELAPETLRGRRRACADVLVRNDGDAPAEVELTADAPELRCGVSPARLRVGPGEQAVGRLEVRAPRRRLKRGAPTPVQVAGHGASAAATFQQRAALPGWAVVLPVVAAAMFAYLAGRPNHVAVPEVTGMTVAQARDKLRAAGLEARQAPLPAGADGEGAGVVRQDPPAGSELPNGGAVTISYYRGKGIGTVTPEVASASVAPSDTSGEPLAYTRANRVLVLFPGEAEAVVGGTVGELSGDPAWDPRTGELAYVRRAAADADAEIVAVDPHAPGTPRSLTEGEGSYVAPAFAPDGGRFAVVAETAPGAGGALCVVVPPATAPHCHADEQFSYFQPVWAQDGIFTLRRKHGTAGQDELVRVGSDLVATGRPLAQGDLRSLAVAPDGRLAVVNAGRIEVHAPAGELLGLPSASADWCDVAWSGSDLIASRGACGRSEQLVRLDPNNLAGNQTPLLEGGDPAIAG